MVEGVMLKLYPLRIKPINDNQGRYPDNFGGITH